MKMMVTALYKALIEAGASEDASSEAASAVAEYQAQMEDIKRELHLIRWMVGTAVAMLIALLFLALRH